MNSVQVTTATVLLATIGLFVATTNAQDGPPARFFFNCQPIDRLFAMQGGLCFQQNATIVNCRNQTCRCTSRPLPTLPTPPPGMGNPFPFPGFPFPFPGFQIPTIPPIPTWNCTTATNSNSSTTTTTASPTSSSTTSTTSSTTTTVAP